MLLRDGEGIDGYEECLVHKFAVERYFRAWEDKNGPFTSPGIDVQIASGLPAGSEFYPQRGVSSRGDRYDRHWITGLDEDLFLVSISDPDGNPTGHHVSHTTARPLPGGAYTFDRHEQWYVEIPCNYKRHSVPWRVSVESPRGTLHEAFFDPVEMDGTIGFSAGDGVIEPSTFLVGGVETTMTSLKWAPSTSVTMELDPRVSLEDHVIAFIALDGSVSLSLDFDEAVMNRGGGVLTWKMLDQPWKAGDKLMIRIRRVG